MMRTLFEVEADLAAENWAETPDVAKIDKLTAERERIRKAEAKRLTDLPLPEGFVR